MPTNVDSFPITAEMLIPAWVKPATVFTTVAGKATTTNVYLPANLKEKAGAPGNANTAVSTDPDYVFAISGEGPATACVPTLVLPPDAQV